MAVVIYVETNFLMSVAMGREARGDDLHAAITPNVSVAIPAECYMESFSAFEDDAKRRGWFRAELEKQIAQLRRDNTSTNAGALLGLLEESRIANDQLLNDVRARLYQLVDRAAGVVERISTTTATLRAAVTEMLIPDPTDNLILHSIIEHARSIPDAHKALLTDNTSDFGTPEVQAALAAVGIARPFRTVTNVLGWLGSVLH